MTKSKKARKKREPSARVSLRKDLLKTRKATRQKIKELIRLEKAKSRDINELTKH